MVTTEQETKTTQIPTVEEILVFPHEILLGTQSDMEDIAIVFKKLKLNHTEMKKL